MKYKNIKSVAHNLGHSFLSDMNAVSERHNEYRIVPAELFALAARASVPRVVVDFLARTVEPGELATPVVQQSVVNYARELFRLCETQNVDAASVRSARLVLDFDYGRRRTQLHHPYESVQEFTCRVEIVDDRGVEHLGEPTNWWLH